MLALIVRKQNDMIPLYFSLVKKDKFWWRFGKNSVCGKDKKAIMV